MKSSPPLIRRMFACAGIIAAVFTLSAALPSAAKPTAAKDTTQSSGRVAALTPAPQRPQAQTNKPTIAKAVATSASTCTNTTFTASFTQGQGTDPAVAQQWVNFRQNLVPGNYSTVAINGTFDGAGRTLTDATIVPQIAAALQNSTGGSWTVGNVTWEVNIGCADSGQPPGATALIATINGGPVSCACTDSSSYMVRPEIGPSNPNWGGVNTATCGGPSQALTVTFSNCPITCAPPPAGMVSWWQGENNGNDAVSGNTLSFYSGPGFVAGEVGQAFNFTGGQAASPGLPSNLNITGNQVTIDGWVNLNATQSQGVFFGKSESGQNDYALFMLSSQLAACIKTNNGTEHFLYSGVVPPNGQWTHIALTYDGTTETIYANGAVVASQSVSGNIQGDGVNFWIGGRSSGGDLTINAGIDEVEVFNRALSAAEIAALYSAGSAGKCRSSCVTPPSNMIAWWPGDGNTQDIQGGNNGQLKNGTSFGAGEVGQAFKFNGVNNYVLVPDNSSLNYTDFTYDAWIAPDPDSPVGDNYIICKGQAGTYLPLIYIAGPAGSHYWRVIVDGTNLYGQGTVTYAYQHIAVTRSGSVGQLYVDGVLQDTETVGTTASGGYDLNFGQIPGFYNNGSFFKGRIDEIEIFNRALTAAEIQSIYGAGSFGKCKPTCVTAPANLVSWWTGDNTAIDIQSGNNGTMKNGATFANGKVAQAFSLDGVNDYVDVGSPGSLNITGPLTVDAWIKPKALGTTQAVYNTSSNAFNLGEVLLRVNPDGTIGWLRRGSQGVPNVLYESTNTNVAAGVWTHIAAVFDGNTLQVYINGVLDSATPSVVSYGGGAPPRVKIGSDDFDEIFNGSIDEVEVFNSALSAGDVASVYNAGSAGKCKTGLFYVSNYNSNTIDVFDNTGAHIEQFAGVYPNFAIPFGLAFDPSGNLLVAYSGGSIQKFDPFGNPSFFGNLGRAYGDGFDLSGNLYAVEFNTNDILKFDPSATSSVFANSSSGLSGPAGLALNESGNLLFVSNANGNSVFAFDLSGVKQATYPSSLGFNVPVGIAFDGNGNFFVANNGGNSITMVDSGGSATVFASSGLSSPQGLTFFDGNLYAASFGSDTIEKYDSAGNGSVFASSGLAHPLFIAVQELSTTATPPPLYTISVSASPSAGGTVSGGGTHRAGFNATVTATANSCYTFTNWTEGNTVVSTSPSYSFIVSGNRTLVANFTINTYTISASASPSAGGNVSGAGNYDCGSTVNLTATANSCYNFTNWTEGNTVVSTSATYSFTATSSRTLVANFTIKTYTISASASPSSAGSISGAGNYNCGSQASLTATPHGCYTFVNWTENGNVVSTSATYAFTVAGNRTLVANFVGSATCPTPTISLSVSTNQINEGQSATFTFSASPVPHKPVTVIYMMKGSAARNTDYTLSGTPLMVTIPADQASATVVLQAIEDNGKREKKEQVTMTISKSSSYKIGKPNQASVQINDD
jgi:hypothetical protein